MISLPYNQFKINILEIYDIENIGCDVLNNKIYPTYLSVDFYLWNHNIKRGEEIIKKLFNDGYEIIKQSGQYFHFFLKIINLNRGFKCSKSNTLNLNLT